MGIQDVGVCVCVCVCVCGLNRGLGGGGAENLFIEDTLKPILDNLHGLAV